MIATKLASYSVLVIDDDEFMRALVKALLHRMGIDDVQLADNGRSGLQLIASSPSVPDVIICDLQMPVMDGVEVLRHLASQSYSGSIILFSGEDVRILRTAENLATAYHLKVLGSLSKPVKYEDMLGIFSHFEPETQTSKAKTNSKISLKELSSAIEQGALEPYYQPKIHIMSGVVIGAEALVRWPHKELGLIPPDAFIPLAEQSNLIDALTLLMFDKVTKQGGLWNQQGFILNIAVNVSMKNLSHFDLPERLTDIATKNNFPPANIELEVTETSLMKNFALTLDILTRLRLKGIGLSIDDFGIGYSSMDQLKRIPFSELKIDYSFVHDAHQDMAARAILDSSIALANKLNMTVVAEGVETQADWDLVAKLGCDLAQGFWMSKPLPANEFISWLENWNAEL